MYFFIFLRLFSLCFFFFNDTATTEIYTLSLHDALPISPERPEILWQFAQAIDGIAEACRALEIPVVGGNVSFYNETSGQAILPTPIIGVVGVLEDAGRRATQW